MLEGVHMNNVYMPNQDKVGRSKKMLYLKTIVDEYWL